jgi:hypothetical protein
MSNNTLIAASIQNMSRSKNAIVKLEIVLGGATTAEQLSSLRSVVGIHLKKSRKWSTEFDMNITNSNIPENSITITLSLKHLSSWKQGKRIR